MKITAKCSCCGHEEDFELNEIETELFTEYKMFGIGMIQNLFPRVPAWIRSGAIDKYSDGFCICPKCSGGEE